ncbi:GAF domain-containing protein [Nocardia sp. alder85J]|uniref:GAF domain-containing protein n=1 Tax=Nocardia sp. alder85J TaxID=2862949 RepID=UPI001CD4C811|nr:GAF domain-containing protein [Nocardia sp. alder85J]MCX4098382.1 DUF5593 domain-containing protein [Nocardia sp. alder85J]
MPWYIIEDLAGGSTPATIVSVGDHRRSRVPATTLDRYEGVDPAGYLDRIRQHGATVSELVTGHYGPRYLEGIPVIGPEEDVYGIQFWLGDPNEPPAPPCAVAGIDWASDIRLIVLSAEAWSMASETTEARRSMLSPEDCLRRIVQFDNAADLAKLATDCHGPDEFAGTATVLHDRGSLMNWHIVAKRRTGEHPGDVRGLVIDISRTEPATTPPPWRYPAPPPSTLTASALLAFSSTFGVPVIAGWIGGRPAWIGHTAPGDPELFHLDDWAPLQAAARSLRDPDAETTIPVRVHAATGYRWHRATAAIRRHPGRVGDCLHVIRITGGQR